MYYLIFAVKTQDTSHMPEDTRHNLISQTQMTQDTRHTHALSWSLPKHNVAKRYFYRNYVRTEGFPEGDDTYWFPYSNAVGVCNAHCACDLWFIYQNILLVFSFVLLFCRHCFVFATGVITFLCLYFSSFLFEVDNYLLKSVKCLEGVG